jgi:hypothetical protein
MWRLEQKMPSKSQMALALVAISASGDYIALRMRCAQRNVRLGVYIVQESSSVLLCKDARETPRLLFHWLHVLNLNYQHVTRLCRLNVKRTGQVVDLGQVNVSHVISRVVVSNLPAGPVDALDLYNLIILDGAVRGYCAVLVETKESN